MILFARFLRQNRSPGATVRLDMVKRIVAAVIVVAVLLASYWAYQRYTGNIRLRDGDVTVADAQPGEDTTAHATPSRSDAPGTINTAPAGSGVNAGTQSASLAQLQAQNNTTPQAGSQAGSAPARDSQSPDAPNGMAFSGSGQFQVYRQGNLTWRINTSDGSTCILFATNAEWRKPNVYNHGCPNG